MKVHEFKIVNKITGETRKINVRANDQKHAINKSKFYLNEGETIVF